MKLYRHLYAYGWIFGGIVLVILLASLTAKREHFCAGGDEHCLREWVSALSGWAALFAAASVLYLAKQVRDADKFQRASTRISLLYDTNTTKYLRALAHTTKSNVNDLISDLRKLDGSHFEADFTRLEGGLTFFLEEIKRSDFLNGSQRYAVYSYSGSVIHSIEDCLRKIDRAERTPEGFKSMRDLAISKPLKLIADFASNLEEGCNNWLADSSAILEGK